MISAKLNQPSGVVPGPIYYFCTNRHTYTLGIFKILWARDIAPHLKIIPYSEAARIRSFGPGTFIFTDFDRVPEPARGRIGKLANHLEAHGCRVLNDPNSALGRYDLLKALHREGINDFDVHRLSQWKEVSRFPVFIRHEDDHKVPVPDLIADKAKLAEAASRLAAGDNDLEHQIIVGMGNVPGADGRYRKYSAFRVGVEIYPADISISDQWWIKYSNSDDSVRDQEEGSRFISENPHHGQLERIFAIANVEYGRADYCVIDDRVQLFEINTNPTISHMVVDEAREQESYARRHEESLLRLLPGGTGPAATPNPFFSASRRESDPDTISTAVMESRQSDWLRWWKAPEAGPQA